MKKKRLLQVLLTSIFILLFVWYAINNQDDLAQLRDISILGLGLIALGKIIVFISNGFFTKWSAEVFTAKLSFLEGIYISILSAIGNFFGPLLGGTSIRAVYLKKYHNLAYSKFTSTLIWYYLILFTLVSAVAVVSILLLEKTAQTSVLLGIFILSFLVLTALMFIKLPVRESSAGTINKYKITHFIKKTLKEIEDGRKLISQDKDLILKLFFVSTLSFAAAFFVSYVEFSLLDIDISLPALGLYTVLVSASILISLTPGAIGIRESMLLIVSSTMGISGAEIVQVAIIDRGVHFLLLIVLFMITRSPKLRKLLTSKEVIV